MVWNLEFEVQFRSMNPAGWPQLVLQCLEQTSSGKELVKAYGCTHVPVSPGMHKRSVKMFSPVETGTLWDYFGIQRVGKGFSTQVVTPEAIAN
mmetsp:Transcript_4680/g.7965  ORF Transcript_4680/g.7965 Transcript_4680/m.7965 type:complete len:93 (+) Transcript_4680:385-663(+)